MRAVRRPLAACLGGALLAGLLTPATALAVPLQTFMVTTLDDENSAGCDAEAGVPGADPGALSFREALCLADLASGGVITFGGLTGFVDLVPGLGSLTYGWQDGTLDVTGFGVTLRGDGTTRLMELDPPTDGGVDVTITGLSFSGGVADSLGGGAILAGAANGGSDTLVLNGTSFTSNRSSSTSSNDHGGAVQFIGGDLAIDSSTFFSNSTAGSLGGAVYFESTSPDDTFTVDGSGFTGNSVATPLQGVLVGGGAVATTTGAGGSATITGSTFVLNTTGPAGGAAATTGGSAVLSTGSLTVLRSTFRDNADYSVADPVGGGAVNVLTGSAQLQYNRFVGNTASNGPEAVALNTQGGATATGRNWFGCNAGPTGLTASCDTAEGGLSPFLVLTGSASPASLVTGGTSTLTAGLLRDSAGGTVAAEDLTAFEGLALTWSGAPVGTVPDANDTLSSGVASTTFSATTAGQGGTATVDNGTTGNLIKVVAPLTFAAVDLVPGRVGVGYPQRTFTATGGETAGRTWSATGLPPGLSLSTAGVLSGTPTSFGSYPVTVTVTDTDPVQSADRVLRLLVGEDVAVGSSPAGITTVGNTAWVANLDSGTVSRLDVGAGAGSGEHRAPVALGAPIAVGSRPVAVEVAPDGLAYVSKGDGSIAVVDGTTVVQTLTSSLLVQPQGMTLSADGATLYVASYGNSRVVSVRTRSGGTPAAVLKAVPAAGRPADVQLAGGKLYVSDNNASRLHVYTPGANGAMTAAGQLPVGLKPAYLASRGTQLLAANVGSGTVSVVDTAAGAIGAVVSTLTVGARSYGVAVDAGTGHIYASSITLAGLKAFDGTTNPITQLSAGGPLSTGSQSTAVAVGVRSDGRRTVLVSNQFSGTVTAYPAV